MLVSEKQMQEGEGLFIYPAASGLGYQSAGAFQRLGRRMETIVRTDEDRKLLSKLPIKIHDSLNTASSRAGIFAPHPQLSFNEAPPESFFEECYEIIQSLRSKESQFHDIWVLPLNTKNESIEDIRVFSEKATLLLSPPAYGFRDHGLFEESLKAHLKKPGLLARNPKDPIWKKQVSAVSFAELAGHLVTIPQNEKFFGQNIRVESIEWTLLNWLEEFRKTFPSESDFFERLATRLSSEQAISDSTAEKLVLSSKEHSLESSHFSWTASHDFFPAPLVNLQRSLNQLFQAHQRHPDLELVFTPSRAIS